MTKLTHVVRVLLGLAFLFFGLNGLFHFMTPPPPTGNAAIVFAGLVADRFLFPTMFGVMFISGAMLMVGRFVPLALALMTPVLVNIAVYHLSVDLAGIGVVAVLTVLEVFLVWSYRDAFKPMLAAKHALGALPTRFLQHEVPSLKQPAVSTPAVPPTPPETPAPALHVQ
jgi:hypothetical protein